MMHVLTLLTLTLAPWIASAGTDAPTDAATDAPTDAPATSTAVPTMAPTSAAPTLVAGTVNMIMTISSVNHTKLVLNSALMQAFVDGIKAQVSSATNADSSNIDVSLSSGSVVATVAVTTEDVQAVNSSLHVNMSSLKQNVVSTVSGLSGIANITYGTIAVSQTSTSVVIATVTPTSQPTSQPTSSLRGTTTMPSNQSSNDTTLTSTKQGTNPVGETSLATPKKKWAFISIAVFVSAALLA